MARFQGQYHFALVYFFLPSPWLLIADSSSQTVPLITLPTKGGYIDLTPPNWRYNPELKGSSTPLKDVKIYACDKPRARRLRQRMKAAASASLFLKEVLENQNGNDTTAAMLDYVFNGAFSKPKGRSWLSNKGAGNPLDNLERVRSRFAAMSQLLTVDPPNKRYNYTHPVRAACIDKETEEILKIKGRQAAVAAPSYALIMFHSDYLRADEAGQVSRHFPSDICKGTKLTTDLNGISLMAHELSHMAGVRSPPGGEVYGQYEALNLASEDATNNAENYELAILYHISGCTDKLFSRKKAPETVPRIESSDELRRKLLNVIFPPGDEANTTDLRTLMPGEQLSAEANDGLLEELPPNLINHLEIQVGSYTF
ncbi:MAG: hypothetical protein M1831_001245 [Alyxoria varia]|nr:MAG: hypothetical protein M1831_001245 [Alyxoria varia]